MFSKKPCAVCAEKDARISDLHRQIADLRRLALPPTAGELHTLVHREADRIMNADSEAIELSPEELEAAALHSGNYDHSQIEVD